MPSEEEVMAVLKKCYDPEIPINIVDLGLVYDVDLKGDTVHVKMTLTAPGCPMHTTISEDVKRKLLSVDGVKEAEVEIVWEPPWTPEKMSETAKTMLGWGI
ncbi:MAG: metal-sulfur cluster assembly factor [Thermoplasmata archaeon]